MCTGNTYPCIFVDALYCVYTEIQNISMIIHILICVVVESICMLHLFGASKFFKILKPHKYLSDQEYCNGKSFNILLKNKTS